MSSTQGSRPRGLAWVAEGSRSWSRKFGRDADGQKRVLVTIYTISSRACKQRIVISQTLSLKQAPKYGDFELGNAEMFFHTGDGRQCSDRRRFYRVEAQRE